MLDAHVFHRMMGVSEASAATVTRGARTISELRVLTDLPVSGR